MSSLRREQKSKVADKGLQGIDALRREIAAMGGMDKRSEESLLEWMDRIRPMQDLYEKWHKKYWSDPANWPPGELAMRRLIYKPELREQALEELRLHGFAEISEDGRTTLNKKGADLQRSVHMNDR